MDIFTKLKKEPRIIVAVVNFITFFLPWLSVEGTASSSVFGQEVSGGASASYTGFSIVRESAIGFLICLIPLLLIAVAFIKQISQYLKYIYLVLPIISLILMFSIVFFLGGVNAQAGGMEIDMNFNRLVGFWLALVCNLAIIVYTLMRDYNISSGEDIKKGIQNLNVETITSQVSDVAKDISGNMQKNIFVECPNCKSKVMKGKKFCSKCGTKIEEELEYEQETEVVCPKCGKNVEKNAKFCSNCGAEVNKKIVCKNCGREFKQTENFCPNCGTKKEDE